jgi:hypothetical protein
VDRLDVDHVADNVVLQQDPVATEHVARLCANPARRAAVVELRETSHGVGELAALGVPADPQAIESDPDLFAEQSHARLLNPPSTRGYLAHLFAMACWTNLPWLPFTRHPTLVLAGDADPIIRC